MKKLFLLIITATIAIHLDAQLKTTVACPAFSVNILEGRVNDLRPNATAKQLKERFPCFTSEEAESDSAKCGGSLFFKDKDIYFYTGRDYIEIGPNFKGKLSLPLMGASRNNLFHWLGNPAIKDAKWDAFQTAYGILILHYNSASKINKIQITTESAETIKLCE